MIYVLWLRGLLSRRAGRLVAAMTGVALVVALLGSVGHFIGAGAASMTARAVAGVPVDWQVQVAGPAGVGAVRDAIAADTPYKAMAEVGYADVSGFQAATGGTVQTTGPGKVLGVPRGYGTTFPGEVRALLGTAEGALLAQQTAANLHAEVGDTITVARVGLPPVTVRVDGIVDLPYADSLFQAVGLPPSAAPQAPPDNVLLLPAAQWHDLFDAQATARPDTVKTQLHVRLAGAFPGDPAAAHALVTRSANNLEARVAGEAIVADNLGARLLGTLGDALYARVLFLFLGLPGALLGVWFTVAVTSSGETRRRREQALLRARGATTGQVLGLEAMEASLVGSGGVVFGLGLMTLADRYLTRMVTAGAPVAAAGGSGALAWTSGSGALSWTLGAAATGLGLALAAVLYPAWTDLRRTTVMAARAEVTRGRRPFWQSIYLDVILLALAAVELWRTAATGYQVVLAPEGVAQTAVHYEAFAAPLCLWLGGVLLATRLWDAGLGRDGRRLAWLLRPTAGGLAGVVAGSLARRRGAVVRGVILATLAVSFAVSTAVFNTTYNAQSRVDAELTNGSDVTVSGSTTHPAGALIDQLRALPGAAAAGTMQHRFAYVGSDLQDIYGIDPASIGDVTTISNAYFAGGDARATLAALAAQPDGVLVSEETVRDFQLQKGDRINLRLLDARDHQYHVVPFHFVGVVREFPTAPTDSFLVANAGYVSQETGSSAQEVVLLRAAVDPATLADRVRALVGSASGLTVSDIASAQRVISSSLTAVDLRGLSALELTFAVVLAAGATGLLLALGLTERRRTFTILEALGATPRQTGGFLWSEGLLVSAGSLVVGLLLGLGVAETLVKVLTGVFDPPPSALSVPWAYLGVLFAAAVLSTVTAVIVARVAGSRPVVEELRSI